MYENIDHNFIIYNDHRIIVIIDNNEKVWFHAIQIAKSIGSKRPDKLIKDNVDNKYKCQYSQINTNIKLDIHPMTNFISEPGLMILMANSKFPAALKFQKWLYEDLIPNLRKFGKYKLKQDYENLVFQLNQKINKLEQYNKTIINDLKKENFPNGGLVYAVDYSLELLPNELDSDEILECYRIGMTNNMNTRKKIYNTHTLHKRKVVYFIETNNPLQLERCLRSFLYNYRYRDNKDCYICSLEHIRKAFDKCVDGIKSMEQKGGNIMDYKLIEYQTYRDKLINKIDKINSIL